MTKKEIILKNFKCLKDKAKINGNVYMFPNNPYNIDLHETWFYHEMRRIMKFIEFYNSINIENIDTTFSISVTDLEFSFYANIEECEYCLVEPWKDLLNHFEFNAFLIGSSARLFLYNNIPYGLFEGFFDNYEHITNFRIDDQM